MAEYEKVADPRFTQPASQLMLMGVVTVLVAVGAYFSFDAIFPVFLASPYLNGVIIGVFLLGILTCFWQVLSLMISVSWIEGFALDRPGHEFVSPPGLLVSLAAMLRKRGARNSLTSSSTRSILDSVATRLDETREITRYIINLLIFLGLLGTFYGLATTVPAVVDTIRSLAPQEGADGTSMDAFGNLMSGLEKQMGGMGTAFGSSLLGLAGSLVVGLLDLFAGHGQGRFFRELDDWMSSITRISFSGAEAETGDVDHFAVVEMLEHTTLQLESLQSVLMNTEERRTETDERISRLAQTVERIVDDTAAGKTNTSTAIERVAHGQEQIATALNAFNAKNQEDTALRIRTIDNQLLRILEEVSVGRQQMSTDLRKDLGQVASALKTIAKSKGGA